MRCLDEQKGLPSKFVNKCGFKFVANNVGVGTGEGGLMLDLFIDTFRTHD